MTQPPQDGYGSPRYRRQRPPPPPAPRQPPPQQLQPRQPPPQPPTAGFGYWDSATQQLPPQPPPQPVLPPQQPPWQPVPPTPPPPYDYEYLFDGAYEEPPPGHAYPPAGPRWAAHSKRKLVALFAGTLIAVLLAGGGVYYMTDSGGGGDTGASAEGGGKADPGAAGERPDGNNGGAQDEDGGGGGKGAGGKRFIGTWQSRGGETLTVGREVRSGKSAGRNAVAYNRPGRLSTCPGVGEARKSGAAFRLALKCVNGKVKSALTGDAVRSGDKLTVEWDGGSKDTFQRQAGRASG